MARAVYLVLTLILVGAGRPEVASTAPPSRCGSIAFDNARNVRPVDRIRARGISCGEARRIAPLVVTYRSTFLPKHWYTWTCRMTFVTDEGLSTGVCTRPGAWLELVFNVS